MKVWITVFDSLALYSSTNECRESNNLYLSLERKQIVKSYSSRQMFCACFQNLVLIPDS